MEEGGLQIMPTFSELITTSVKGIEKENFMLFVSKYPLLLYSTS
jgi:hypothetical protein